MTTNVAMFNAHPIVVAEDDWNLRRYAERHINRRNIVKWTNTGKLVIVLPDGRHRFTGWEVVPAKTIEGPF